MLINKNLLQPGDYVLILGTLSKWEEDDYLIGYGDDICPIPLTADIMIRNGFCFKDPEDSCMVSEKEGILIYWNPKTRNIRYLAGDFNGGIHKIDTVDKFQHFLRMIGFDGEIEI